MSTALKGKKRWRKFVLIALVSLLGIGMIIPQSFVNPVEGATQGDWNPKSFWFYPWGKSVTHKGVDIFANEGTTVQASTYGLVIFSGKISMGGKVVFILGPKWRFHYYAHLKVLCTSTLSWVKKGSKIGEVGTTGNAAGKSPHLHYSITTMIPYPWRIDSDRQGWRKMFYLNPMDYL